MASKNFFDLASSRDQKKEKGGTIIRVTADEMLGLVDISFSSLRLDKGASLNPIWHPNAHKIGYCLHGSALVSIRSPGGVDIFTIDEGEMFFIPKGYVHRISNREETETHFIFSLNHSKPEEMTFFQAIHSLSETVFNSTFNTSPNFFNGLMKSKEQHAISTATVGKEAAKFIPSRFKFNLKASAKVILTQGGYVQAGTKSNLPILEGLGVLRFGLNPKGAVEPHWHTNAGELIYIIKGKTRITVLAPDGNVDVLEVNGGQGAFAAASHFHNIENIGPDKVEVMAFFSHPDPDFIGAGEVMGSYSNEELASLFNVSPQFFDQFKKPSGPLVIVPI
jgi:oxalate decarboxylase